MNYFLFWCRPLLVAFPFHDLTSLLPPSFQKNDFSTCSTHYFYFGAKPSKTNGFVLVRRAHSTHAHTATPPQRMPRVRVVDTCTQMASFAVCSRGGPRSTIDMCSCNKTIARDPCTPPSTLKTCGEKISAEACSGKEVGGLLRKKMMMKITRKS